MKLCFDKPTCQNIRKSLRKEWLETNGLGDYASSSLICCNTRKYHGLLVSGADKPSGRHVLLSAVEESLLVAGREFPFSCRKHPGVYFPRGHEYLHQMETGLWPTFAYRFGDVRLTRELMLMPGKTLLIIRYLATSDNDDIPPMTLKVRPLLAFRHFHSLTTANGDLQVKTYPIPFGFKMQPYNSLPTLNMQVDGDFSFYPSPDWYRDVEYLVEQERGFPFREDLFQPGVFEMALEPGKPVYLTASTEPVRGLEADCIASMWEKESARRLADAPAAESLEGHLAKEGDKFLIVSPLGGPRILAGYHWFDAWGRDTLIALPGLTFCAGRPTPGLTLLAAVGKTARQGLIPNCFSDDGKHAYNSVDASLWYVWAVQQLMAWVPGQESFVRDVCWPVIRDIIDAYSTGRAPHVQRDNANFLHVGDPSTQLTWMDASVDGMPVTSRHGCPVEINALWYNALAFADEMGRKYGETAYCCADRLDAMRKEFIKRYWVKSTLGDYLADVWRPDGPDTRVRPNQVFAVSLPCPILEEDLWPEVLQRLTTCLLTPYGLRSLAPSAPDFIPLYEGGPRERDSAYHQGTVWAWLMGPYGEAMLKASWDKDATAAMLLKTFRPLFSQHLGDAGMGSISEIFDATPPHLPNGCVAQAWSVAEALRLLRLIQKAAPDIYADWEIQARKGGK